MQECGWKILSISLSLFWPYSISCVRQKMEVLHVSGIEGSWLTELLNGGLLAATLLKSMFEFSYLVEFTKQMCRFCIWTTKYVLENYRLFTTNYSSHNSLKESFPQKWEVDTFTQPLTIQYVDKLVSSLEQMWRNWPLHQLPIFCSEWVPWE